MISKSFKICNSLLGSGSVQLETDPGRKGKVSKMDKAALGTKCDPLPGDTRINPFRSRHYCRLPVSNVQGIEALQKSLINNY